MLPGMDLKDVNIQVQENTLAISGERSTSEISYGSFERAISLPEGVDKDRLTAEYRNGTAAQGRDQSASRAPVQARHRLTLTPSNGPVRLRGRRPSPGR